MALDRADLSQYTADAKPARPAHGMVLADIRLNTKARDAMKKQALTMLATMALLMAGATNGPPAARAESDVLQFGTTGRSDSTSIATFIAIEKKLFEAENLKVNWIPAGSAARAVQQTVAGSLDLSIAATDATVRAIAEGGALKIVAGTVGAAPFRVVGDKSVGKWADLRGKTISVGGPSDQTLFFLRVIARKNGLADKDYDLVYAGTTPARFAQLMSGAIGAAVLTNPNDILALNNGYRDLGAAPDYVPVWSQNNAFVNAAYARGHRAEIEGFLRAYRKAVAFFRDPVHRDETLDIMKRYSGADAATAERIYRDYIDQKIIVPDSKISADGIQAVVDSLVAAGELKTPPKVADFIDTSYLGDDTK
jgi:ABC-type nitrate/sulfonate/bicarbonate transport system substrate-binding protein